MKKTMISFGLYLGLSVSTIASAGQILHANKHHYACDNAIHLFQVPVQSENETTSLWYVARSTGTQGNFKLTHESNFGFRTSTWYPQPDGRWVTSISVTNTLPAYFSMYRFQFSCTSIATNCTIKLSAFKDQVEEETDTVCAQTDRYPIEAKKYVLKMISRKETEVPAVVVNYSDYSGIFFDKKVLMNTANIFQRLVISPAPFEKYGNITLFSPDMWTEEVIKTGPNAQSSTKLSGQQKFVGTVQPNGEISGSIYPQFAPIEGGKFTLIPN